MFLAAIQMFYLHTHACVLVCVCDYVWLFSVFSLSLFLFAVSLGFCIFIHIWRKSVQKGTCLHYNFRFSQSHCPSKLYRSVPDARTWGQGVAFHFCFLVFHFFFVGLTLAGQFLASLYLGYVCVVFPECLSRCCWLAGRVCRSCCTVARCHWLGGTRLPRLARLSSADHCLQLCHKRAHGCLCHVVYALLLRCQTAVAPNVNVTLLWLTFASEPSERIAQPRDATQGRGNLLLLLTLFNMLLISTGELTTHEIQTANVARSHFARSLSLLPLPNMRSACCIFHCQPFFCDLIKILAQLRLIRFRFHFRSPFSRRVSRVHVASGSVSLIRSVGCTKKIKQKCYLRHA